MTRQTLKITLIALMFQSHAYAAAVINPDLQVCKETTCTGNETYVNVIGCRSPNITNTCYNNQYALSSCTACSFNGDTLTSQFINLPCGMLATYNDCFQSCKSASDCGTATDYTCSGGYCKRTVPVCGLDARCTTRTEYACDVGYYGTTLNGTSGCNRCSYTSEFGRAGDTSGIGTATTQDDCYIPSNATFRVTSGTGIITNNCYYQS